ncbi:cytochrome P450 81E8-like [Phalaenopsis equestris]|uniref:cytochrome P450 81E8-like n=1 Tax=Phalaenopsis equestris TaxID=78828 RepID=UPI0009E2C3B8|nr:cytochrome P450 81E8-like [Phalaenopsis equestris]
MDAINIITFLGLFLSLLLATNLFLSNKSSLKKNLPPSLPNSLPILGHLYLLKKPLHQSLAHLSAKHGPILLLRFGIRPVLVVSSASLAEECFTTNDATFADRPRFPSVSVITYNYTSLPFAAYGPDWREMRRIATIEALSCHRLAFFAYVLDDEARALVRHLFRNYGMVELRPSLFGRLNVKFFISFLDYQLCQFSGKRYYGEDDGKDNVVYKFKEVIEKITLLSGMTNVGDFLSAMIMWITSQGVKRKMVRYHKYRDKIIQSLIEERRRKKREEDEDKKDGELKEKNRINKTMIDALLSLQEKQPKQYTDVFIKALILSLISAGTDTSSNTIEWSMSLLLNNPDKLEKARQEIEKQVGHDHLLDESDLTKLPYLHCIINETLRLYPVGPLLPHIARENCKVGGYDVDRGTMLLVNVYEIHRDPMLWLEPTKFVPERFQNVEVGGKLMSFGLGRRRCPGEGLGLKEVGLVLGTLIQCFEWKRIGPEKVDMTQGSGISMPRANRLKALCSPREYMISLLSKL